MLDYDIPGERRNYAPRVVSLAISERRAGKAPSLALGETKVGATASSRNRARSFAADSPRYAGTIIITDERDPETRSISRIGRDFSPRGKFRARQANARNAKRPSFAKGPLTWKRAQHVPKYTKYSSVVGVFIFTCSFVLLRESIFRLRFDPANPVELEVSMEKTLYTLLSIDSANLMSFPSVSGLEGPA